MENILLKLSVKMSGYHGDWRSAIDEAYELSKRLGVGCSLDYTNQYLFRIYPTTTQEDIDRMKETKVVIGM
tara:strand:- start:1715 stop:1927 length:213 start_codon:yes stop_codon:yes gene_type:complete